GSLSGGDGTGHFIFTPDLSATSATCTYTASSNTGVGSTGPASTTASLTFTLNNQVWYVDNTFAGTSDGRSNTPFKRMDNGTAGLGSAAGTGDYIYVSKGSGSTAGNYALLANQTLAGAGATFTLGPLTISGSAANTPTLSGTLSASGATGLTTQGISISTSGIPAINFTNAGGSLTFRSVSANGGANGIVLTGQTGSFTVTGDGTNNSSGGTIQSMTGAGISMTGANNVSLTSMNIQNTSNSGIAGTQVVNFSFINGTINSNGTHANTDSSNIAFNTAVTGTENNVSGTVTITGSTLTNAFWHGVDIQNFNGTLSNVNISGNTLTSSTDVTLSLGSGIRLQAIGSATTAANITAAQLQNNIITYFPSGAGILAQGGNSNTSGPSGNIGIPGNGAALISITGNQIQGEENVDNHRIGTSAIFFAVTGKGQGNADISNNGTVAHPLTNVAGHVIGVGVNGDTTATVVTNNNVIVANNTVSSNAISGGTGVTFGAADTPNLTWTIVGNTTSNTDGDGILAVARGTTGTLNVKIQNNNVGTPLSGVHEGIRVDSGNANSINETVCLNISGNTSAGSGGVQGIGLRKQGTSTTVNQFNINGMSATSSPGVETYVNGLNPAGNGTLLISATSGFGNCSLP
ncbi:MAG TPA: hypothetical protein VKU01_14115, partial [Bryobacteraceae bacterium]|nr:hypothetical protein [Bryobacteraceae bacterium]